MKNTIINTSHGEAIVQVVDHGQHWQYNCFMPPGGGAGIFALLPPTLSEAECSDTMRRLIEAGPHAEDQSLTHLDEKLVAGRSFIGLSSAPRSYKPCRDQLRPSTLSDTS